MLALALACVPKTFQHFTGIAIDGTTVPSANYDAVSGSVVLSLKPTYLQTLATGEHVLTAQFDDGAGTARFTVLAQTGSGSDSTDTSNTDNNSSARRTTGSSTAARQGLSNTDDASLSALVPMALGAVAAFVGIRHRSA